MNSDDRTQLDLGLLARLAGVFAFELGAVAVLHWAGRYQFLRVPFGDLDRWLSDAPPEDVLAAAIRLLGLVLAYWVLASTVLYAVGLLAGRPQLLRSLSWVMLPGARRVLDGVLAVSITGSSLTASLPASADSLATAAVYPSDPHAAQVAPPDGIASKLAIYPQSAALQPLPPTARTHVVAGGQSYLDIAAQQLGAAARWTDIWHANAERIQAAGLAPDARPQIGWVLVLPEQPTQHPPASPVSADELLPETVTVEPGDNLWDISEAGLAGHLQRAPANEEIAPYWQATIDTNVDRLASGDPDLIFPGERVTLPPPPGDPATPQPVPPPNGDRTPLPTPPTPPATDEAPPPATSSTTATTPSTTGTPSTATTAPSTSPSTSTATPPTAAAAAPDSTRPDSADEEEDSPLRQAGVIAAAGVTTALAGLTLRALARRRRARRRTARPGTETPPRSADDLAAELALASASTGALDRAWAAAQHLGDAAAGAELPMVTGIVVAPTGDVTLHLRNPARPLAPFTETPAGTSVWLLPASRAEIQDTGDDAAPVLETVVAVGRTDDGSWVFLDLESLGAITVDGDPTQAARLVRSITAELALQPANHYVDVTVAGGIEPPGVTEHQGVMVVDHLDDTLVRQLQRAADETATYLSTEGAGSTHTARALDLPRDSLVVTVVVTNRGTDSVLLDRLADAAMPGGRGLAVVALDPLNDPATQLLVDPDGTLHLPHLGLTVTAAGLDVDELHQLDDLLQREPETVTPSTPQPADHEPAALPTVPPWDYQVRLFADHRVETADGEPVSFRFGDPGVANKNTARGAELLSYLALRPGRSASLDEIRDHLWWGKPISARTADTLVSGTRRVLGGVEHLTPAEGEPGHKRYRLQPTVVTDLDLLEHDLAHAQAIADDRPSEAAELLRQRLAAIDSPAFHEHAAGAGLADWAAANRVIDRVQQPVIDASLLAADLYTSQGPDGRPNARWAIDQALKACPDNEALTRAGMQLDALSGHREAAHSRYIALARKLALDELEPEPETTAVHRDIMSPSHPIG